MYADPSVVSRPSLYVERLLALLLFCGCLVASGGCWAAAVLLAARCSLFAGRPGERAPASQLSLVTPGALPPLQQQRSPYPTQRLRATRAAP